MLLCNWIVHIFKKLNDIHLDSWLSAIGTITASIVALYFGIKGNKEVRILISRDEKLLNKTAFEFLIKIITCIYKSKENQDELLINFDKKIREISFIREKKLKIYNNCIYLATNWFKYNFVELNEVKAKNLFYKIKHEARKLYGIIDSSTKYLISEILEKDFKLIRRCGNKIIIRLNKKLIVLRYKSPKSFNELSLSEN